MKVFFNDLSLNGQFTTEDTFKQETEKVVLLIQILDKFRVIPYCSYQTWELSILNNEPFKKCIFLLEEKFKKIMLRYIEKGPFWEDERLHNSSDNFYLKDRKVTDYSIAEAAENQLKGISSSMIGYINGHFSRTYNNYYYEIIKLIKEKETKKISIDLIDSEDKLLKLYQNSLDINDWQKFIQNTESVFGNLVFLSDVVKEVKKKDVLCKELQDKVYSELSILDK
jgi:hypothetical protein